MWDFGVMDGDILEFVGQVGGESGERGLGDASGLHAMEEDGVIDGIKSSTVVKEEEYNEGAAIKRRVGGCL